MADRRGRGGAKIVTRKRYDSSRSNPSKKDKPDTNDVLLTSLSQPQIASVLNGLQLIAIPSFTMDDCLKLLQCSKVFMGHFNGYALDDIFAQFDKSGDFIDFYTRDRKINGIFPDSKTGMKMFPCCICANEVTDEEDEDDEKFGCECSLCGEYFHNSCCSKPMSRELHDTLAGSPNFVKVLCPRCNASNDNLLNRLQEIEKRCKSMEDKFDAFAAKPSTYSSALTNAPEMAKNITNNVVKQLKVKNNTAEETEERNKRTVLIRKPESKDIRNSKDLRSAFNKEFPGTIIRQCRVTAGGSFKIELDKESEAKTVKDNCSTVAFGGNSGVTTPNELQTSGIIKHVYQTEDEAAIEDHLKQHHKVTKVEFFKPKGTFRGTVKITMNTRQELLDIIRDRISIFQQRYIVEEFKPVPRVIKCNRCQSFGHIARRCFSDKVKCGECGSSEHESNACTSSIKKCSHCNESHSTGDRTCSVMIKKLEEITNRYQYGQ